MGFKDREDNIGPGAIPSGGLIGYRVFGVLSVAFALVGKSGIMEDSFTEGFEIVVKSNLAKQVRDEASLDLRICPRSGQRENSPALSAGYTAQHDLRVRETDD